MRRRILIAALLLCVVSLLTAVATAENPLVYVSFITGITSGGTNIYEITSGGAKLIGTLGKGGGGPVAVDAQENVYVVEADIGSTGYQMNSPIFVYPRGSMKGKHIFTAKNLGAEAMTVAADGTIYIAGQVPNSNIFSVVKFAPPNYSRKVLRTAQDPRYPTGISLDASGNLFVGWYTDTTSVYVPCYSGCIQELPAGQKKWQVRLPDLAANSMGAGPFATTNGSLVFWTYWPTSFDYIETVSSGRHYPSQLIQVLPSLFVNPGGNPALAFNGGGTELWATGTGVGATLGTNVVEIDYPSGKVPLTFPVTSPSNLGFLMGIAVSPAYFP
jgi:hypothetical protein